MWWVYLIRSMSFIYVSQVLGNLTSKIRDISEKEKKVAAKLPLGTIRFGKIINRK